jgi:hypothetical protein
MNSQPFYGIKPLYLSEIDIVEQILSVAKIPPLKLSMLMRNSRENLRGNKYFLLTYYKFYNKNSNETYTRVMPYAPQTVV